MSATKTDKEPDLSLVSKSRKRDYVTKLPSFTRQRASSTLPSPMESEFEDPMQMLYHDYGRCLEQLSMLQAAIGVTSQISFRSEADRVYGCRDAALTFELIDQVKWHGENTVDCLKACLMNSVALRKIEQKAKASRQDLPRDSFYKASYAEFLIRPEETEVVGGIPRDKRGGTPPVLTFDTELSELHIDPHVDVAGFGAHFECFSARRSTSRRLVHELPSVEDLVRRWTSIPSNDADVELGATSSADGHLVTE